MSFLVSDVLFLLNQCDLFSFFVRYIPDATGAIYEVLQEMARSHTAKRKRYEGKDAELLKKVSVRLITKETLSEKLAQHVEQVNSAVLVEICFILVIASS